MKQIIVPTLRYLSRLKNHGQIIFVDLAFSPRRIQTVRDFPIYNVYNVLDVLSLHLFMTDQKSDYIKQALCY
jgi:hypothetical protein